jgi:hypothetical protein
LGQLAAKDAVDLVAYGAQIHGFSDTPVRSLSTAAEMNFVTNDSTQLGGIGQPSQGFTSYRIPRTGERSNKIY